MLSDKLTTIVVIIFNPIFLLVVLFLIAGFLDFLSMASVAGLSIQCAVGVVGMPAQVSMMAILLGGG